VIRTDGAYVFYRIQHLDASGWQHSNLDYFGYPRGFSASGKCWQKLGEDATFELPFAKLGIKFLRRKHPKEKFRLIEVAITQITRPVEEKKYA
jgi:hypothetical protein